VLPYIYGRGIDDVNIVFAEYYDLFYATLKDYPLEAAQIATLLRRLNPRCRTVLDVACGTGEHARLLAGHGFSVDGLDLDPAFVEIARQKHPAGRFVQADMRDFHFGRRYDAVLCLFSSIGYVRTLDRVESAFRSFGEHLAPGAVLLVEPWFAPGVLDPARVTRNSAETGGVRVSREIHLELDGLLSRLYYDYEITDAAGTRRATEMQELGLFTTAELLDAFRRAGLEATYDPKGLTDRGLYIARIGARARV
jgi:SAM-dependent methyltransferase